MWQRLCKTKKTYPFLCPPNHPILLFLMSMKNFEKRLTHDICDRLEKWFEKEPSELYNNLLLGKCDVVKNGNTFHELELYAILAFLAMSYGMNSYQFQNIKDNVFMYSKVDYHFLEAVIDTIKNVKILYDYEAPTTFDQFIAENNPLITIPDKCRILLFSDWGVGNQQAIDLLQKATDQFSSIDYFIHLGDVYYTGTEKEFQEKYINLLENILLIKHPKCRILTLAGNHDLYGGGKAYYQSLKHFNQPSSFFVLQNKHVQINALNTGYEDSKVQIFPEYKNTNYGVPKEEAEWHFKTIMEFHKKKHIMLSHHGLLTNTGNFFQKDDRFIPVNEKLYHQFKSVINMTDIWYYGHQHSYVVFDPYTFPNSDITIQRARLIGYSGCQEQDTTLGTEYTKLTLDTMDYPIPDFSSQPWTPLQNNGILQSLGFVELLLENEKITSNYFECPVLKVGKYGRLQVNFSENL